MNLIAIFGAAALVAGPLVAAAPAQAQYRDYDRGYHGDHRGWDDRGRGHDRRGFRGYDRHEFRGYDRGRGYGYGRGYGRSRVVCRVHRGYYGPERSCFRVYR